MLYRSISTTDGILAYSVIFLCQSVLQSCSYSPLWPIIVVAGSDAALCGQLGQTQTPRAPRRRSSCEAMAQDNWKNETTGTECQKRDGPILCANNCGFFGSAVTNNLCSKCYRDFIMKQQLEAAASLALAAEKLPSMASSSVIVETIKEESDASDKTCLENIVKNQSEEQCNKKPANRCWLCNKRVGLTGFKCRCGGTFCSSHRYSENHECSFNYKGVGREAIAKANPVVKADKIEKI